MIKQFLIFILLSCACTKVQAQDFDITTIVGNGALGYGGDGGLAIDCELYLPEGLCFDNFGNLYIADALNSRVRKVMLSTGIITTVAGIDTPGFSGDGTLATNAELFEPDAVFTDKTGNVYIADALNDRVRKITISTGIITTIAGTGNPGTIGDGGLATNAELDWPVGLCLDKAGNIYIADYLNNKVKKIEATTNIITTIAGTGTIGFSGDNGPATNAELDGPEGLFADSNGNIFICDQYNYAVRRIDAATGIITTIAGTGTMGYSGDGGLAINAELNQPSGVFIDKQDNVFIADYENGAIRKIDGATGVITTIAGNGTYGFGGDGGPATDAELAPGDVWVDSSGIVYIADYGNMRIRMLYNPLGVKPPAPKGELSIFPNPVNDVLYINNAAGYGVKIW